VQPGADLVPGVIVPATGLGNRDFATFEVNDGILAGSQASFHLWLAASAGRQHRGHNEQNE